VSDDTTTETPEPVEAPAPDAPPPAEPQQNKYDELVALNAEIRKLKKDTASEVSRLKSEAQTLRSAKTEAVEQFEGLMASAAAAEMTVAKYKACIAEGIPVDSLEEAVSLVNGTDPESIAESVAAVKSLMGRAVRDLAVDPYQGSGNSVALNSDELENTLRSALGI
jgi:hypothetical protein